MKVLITDSNFETAIPEAETLARAGITVERLSCKTEDDVIAVGRKADAWLVQFAPITRRVLEACPNCRLVVRYGIGVDNVDLEAARQLGVTVCNVPRYCLDEVADHTVAMILALHRKLFAFHQSVLSGQWDVARVARPLLKTSDFKIGLVGLGNVGRRTVSRLRGFGYQIFAYDPYISEQQAGGLGCHKTESFEELLRSSDGICLHTPLTLETQHMINEETLQLMLPHAFLVNTSRGALVDTVALAEALRTRTIAAAGLDVFEEEPLPPDHPLRSCQNVILTPHAAFYSDSSIETLQVQAAEEVVRWARGETLDSPVVHV